MRNKAAFIEAAYSVLKEELHEDLNVVEDAAQQMNHLDNLIYRIPKEYTTTGKNEEFYFERKPRQATNDETKQILDFYYVGKENDL